MTDLTKLADALELKGQSWQELKDREEACREAARILRAAAAVDVAGLIELAAKAIYDQWADKLGWVEWVPGGNSLNQDEARRIARAALESALRMALAARKWQPIKTAPEKTLVVCMWLDDEDTEHPERYALDYLDEDIWQNYFNEHEHYLIAGAAKGRSEDAPYTHWMPLPAAAPKGTP